MTVALLGATGTIGRATRTALRARGHRVLCLLRPGRALADAESRPLDVADAAALRRVFAADRVDAVVSCMASRTGVAADAWAIDHAAHSRVLAAAMAGGARHFVLLSAICVQKPRLAFQHAKLAFEAELMAAPLTWSIVRPTAYFKSLAGQIARVRDGRPYLMFGDGRLTACKPIADEDLADYIADCLTDAARANRVLPIGGPGPALTPRDMGEHLFRLLGRPPRFREVPPGLLAGIAGALGAGSRLWTPLAAKAELARIGHYYATESMLLLDPRTGRYDAGATPETGTRTLPDYFADVLAGRALVERGDHAVF